MKENFDFEKQLDDALFGKDEKFLDEEQSSLNEKIERIKKKLAVHGATGKEKFNERLRIFKNLGSFIEGGFDIEKAMKESVLPKIKGRGQQKSQGARDGHFEKVEQVVFGKEEKKKEPFIENGEERELNKDNKLLKQVLEFLEEYNNEGGYKNEARIIDWEHESFNPKVKFHPEVIVPLVPRKNTKDSVPVFGSFAPMKQRNQEPLKDLKKFQKISKKIVEKTKEKSLKAYGDISKEVMTRKTIKLPTSEKSFESSQGRFLPQLEIDMKKMNEMEQSSLRTLTKESSGGQSPTMERDGSKTDRSRDRPSYFSKRDQEKKLSYVYIKPKAAEAFPEKPSNKSRRNAVCHVDYSTVVQALKILLEKKYGEKRIKNKRIEKFYNYAMKEGRNRGGLLSALFDAVNLEKKAQNQKEGNGTQSGAVFDSKIDEIEEDSSSSSSPDETVENEFQVSNQISGDVVRLKEAEQNGGKVLRTTRLSQRHRLPLLAKIEQSKDSSDRLSSQIFKHKMGRLWVELSQDANEVPTQNTKQFRSYSNNLSDLYQRMETNYQAYFVKRPGEELASQRELLTKTEMKVLQEISTYSFLKKKQFALRKKHLNMV